MYCSVTSSFSRFAAVKHTTRAARAQRTRAITLGVSRRQQARRVGSKYGGGTMCSDGVVSGDELLCREEIGGLTFLGERHRRLSRHACCVEVLRTLAAGIFQSSSAL
jgi:hypothetical protein